MYRGRRGGRRQKRSTGTFDVDDATRVKHTKIGVWDMFEEITHWRLSLVPGFTFVQDYTLAARNLPYVWRMIKDVGRIKSCWLLLVLFVIVEIAASLIPAVKLWYSGQMLKIVESAVQTRAVDRTLLIRVVIGRISCTLASRVLTYFSRRLNVPLNKRIKRFYSDHIFHAKARLDLQTFEDESVQSQLDAISSSRRSSLAFETLTMFLNLFSTATQLLSQVSVLMSVLKDQRDGPMLACLSLAQSLLPHFAPQKRSLMSGVWAATTKNEDYVRMQGMKHVVDNPVYRKEFVVGNLGEHLTSEFRTASARVGDDAGDFFEERNIYAGRDQLGFSLLQEPLRELPQIVFTLRAVQYPASIPISLASLHLIQQTVTAFSQKLTGLLYQTNSIIDQLAAVRKLYEVDNIPNRIVDGTVPFPENQQELALGVSVEFRNVSFQYPGTQQYALHNTSFKIEKGQLCVLVGKNGSGKSTILKLITRLYDCTEGEILIDSRNIKDYKMADLRRATAVLFQDFTIWPLSIRDNIGLGDPENADDEEKIHQAAVMGGADEFIDRLPDGYNTYLDRPVRDYYMGLPEGTKNLFGRSVDYKRLRGTVGNTSTSLSGGQMQRLAVARTFMRSTASEHTVGLLLFDEPSAALDPSAEHDLFERLRKLRGNKTMIFSSHRFGNLTRYADLILFMSDSVVVEAGTHEQLVKSGGEYARLWGLQAQAFLP